MDDRIESKKAVANRLLDQESETLLTEMTDDQLLRFVALDISRATTEE